MGSEHASWGHSPFKAARSRRSTGIRPLLGAKHPVCLSIGCRELSQHPHFLGSVPRGKAFDRDFSPWFDDVRLVAVTNHAARRAGLEGPPLHLAAGILHIEEKPRMRVCQPAFNDHPLYGQRLRRIVRGGKRVMRPRWNSGAERNQNEHQCGVNCSLHSRPPVMQDNLFVVPFSINVGAVATIRHEVEMPFMHIPNQLAAACRRTPALRSWLEALPDAVHRLQSQWSLSWLGVPFDGNDVNCAWVAPVVCQDGSAAVLKLGMPHMEGTHEIHGLRFWDGEPTVRLLKADEGLNAMLLEPCEPGTTLRHVPEPTQDVVIAELLRRLWRVSAPPHPFRPLSVMTANWANETTADSARWPDCGLVQEGLRLFEELSRPSANDVLLATDLHAGNVLQAHREPWLVIDPKPFVGDPAYDATQHLLNSKERVRAQPKDTIRRFADLLGVDDDRVRLWMFARLVAEPHETWEDERTEMARRIGR